jgi:hypothetical protein
VKPIGGLMNTGVNYQRSNIRLDAVEEIVTKTSTTFLVKLPAFPKIFLRTFK